MELKYNSKEPTSKNGMPREMFLPWAGWFPHPELDRDITPHPWGVSEAVQQTLNALPPIPSSAKYFIPNGISLAEFHRHRVECSEGSILEALIAHVTRDRLTQVGATEDGKALAGRKPLDGIIAFVWRYAQYHSGQALAIPVTAFWDLDDGISSLTGVRGGASEEVVGFLEQKAHELVEITGGEKNVAELRWARIMGRLD